MKYEVLRNEVLESQFDAVEALCRLNCIHRETIF